MPLPNSLTYNLTDVVDEINPPFNVGLDACFFYASSPKFHPRYEGDRDRLSNFRDYGYDGTLTLVNTLDITTLSFPYGIIDMDANENSLWVHAIVRNTVDSDYITLNAFTVTSTGVIYRLQYGGVLQLDSGSLTTITALNNDAVVVFFVNTWSLENDLDDRIYFEVLTYNSASGYTTVQTGFSALYTNRAVIKSCTNGDFVFLIGRDKYVDCYEVGSPTPSLTLRDSYEMNNSPLDIYYQNGYLVVVGGTELRTFTVNSSGIFSLIDHHTAGDNINLISGNKTNLLYAVNFNRFSCFEISSSGVIQSETYDSTTPALPKEIIGLADPEFLIVRDQGIQSFRVDNNLLYIEEYDIFSNPMNNICINNNNKYILVSQFSYFDDIKTLSSYKIQ